jgi:hypothetical protein
VALPALRALALELGLMRGVGDRQATGEAANGSSFEAVGALEYFGGLSAASARRTVLR